MHTKCSDSLLPEVADDNIISYDKINDYVTYRELCFVGIKKDDAIKFHKVINENIYKLIDKREIYNNRDTIVNCFEISCNILYDRKILQEVVEKQKKYEIEYVVDFFRYVLRIFLKRCDKNNILTKNQCDDIRNLCKMIISIDKSNDEIVWLIDKISAKDIVKCIKKVEL